MTGLNSQFNSQLMLSSQSLMNISQGGSILNENICVSAKSVKEQSFDNNTSDSTFQPLSTPKLSYSLDTNSDKKSQKEPCKPDLIAVSAVKEEYNIKINVLPETKMKNNAFHKTVKRVKYTLHSGVKKLLLIGKFQKNVKQKIMMKRIDTKFDCSNFNKNNFSCKLYDFIK